VEFHDDKTARSMQFYYVFFHPYGIMRMGVRRFIFLYRGAGALGAAARQLLKL
jgi:hypothetical protein